jgi:uncharacterized protein
MPEVIADTSPIQYLYQTDLLDLLPTLYCQITIPQAVVHELAQGRTQGVNLPDPVSLSWISVCPVQESDLIPPLPDLGLGEREAVTIPESLAILDDALARNYARQLGISIHRNPRGVVESQTIRIYKGDRTYPGSIGYTSLPP